MIAAVVASERAIAHMKRHADAAVRARDHVAANVALQKIVEPAAIEKHHALAARRKIFAQRTDQGRRERHSVRNFRFRIARPSAIRRLGCGELARLGDFAAHIDDFDRRHRAVVHAPQETQQPVTSAAGVRIRLARGRRRAEHDGRLRKSRERDREIACVIVDPFLAFVRRVVFFVDDDQSDVAHRRENHRARTDHHACLPANCRHPARPSLGHALRAVRDADQRSEARAKRAHDFVGQRDLGHHDKDVAPGRERSRGEVQINFSLAAGGDAPQEKRFVTPMLDRR